MPASCAHPQAMHSLDNRQRGVETCTMPLIRRATIQDAPRLSELGASTFRDTFEADNAADDIAAYIAEAFTPQRQEQEIADPASIVLLVEDEGVTGSRELIGYAHLVSGPAPECVPDLQPIELKRFYITRAHHGRGVARVLMHAALAAAREAGARTVWLGVWERNARAIAFYEKCGFVRAGEQIFMLGADRQTDWVMVRSLDADQTAPGREGS